MDHRTKADLLVALEQVTADRDNLREIILAFPCQCDYQMQRDKRTSYLIRRCPRCELELRLLAERRGARPPAARDAPLSATARAQTRPSATERKEHKP